MTTKPSLCSNFTGNACHFAGEPVELIHHRVESFLELQDFAADIHGDFSRKVATRNRSCDFCNVSHLTSQVASHKVHVVGEVFPGTAHTGHLRLATKLTFGTHFAGHPRHLAREGVELVHHCVDGVLKFQNFSLYVYRDLAGQVAAGHSRSHLSNVSDLSRQVSRHGVH